ncbi:MAG: hypothetical protein Q8P12_04375, partial [bacterium]|nr:hypothetical protein [bacterium]
TLVSEALIGLFTFFMVAKTTHAWPRLVIAGKALAAGLGMYVTLITLPHLPVLVALPFGAIIYFVVLWLLGGIRLSTMKQFLRT